MSDFRGLAKRALRKTTGRRAHHEPKPPEAAAVERAPVPGSSLIDAAVYRDGRRVSTPSSLAETYREARSDPETMAWIGLYRPTPGELKSLAIEFDLHPLALEDALEAHQRSKLERYGDTLFVVLRAARYLDDDESVDFGELHIFVGPGFVITVRHGAAPDLAVVRKRMEAEPELLARGHEAVLYAIFDAVVDGYVPVVAGLQNDIDEIETEVFGGDPQVSRRIYELSREVVQFQRAVRPLSGMLRGLISGFEKYGIDEELRRYLRDVADHAVSVMEQVDSFRQALADILTVNATLVAQQQNAKMQEMTETSLAQNDEIKKISSWAAILFAPTLIGTVYGMNFDYMPETHWKVGYPMAIVAMAATCVTLYLIFKRRNWL
ncbi:magnesium/cobalt transporter CorA [Stackebrandtia nassauensis]|uniref:Magnesium transport protein CorA n=1 Tax=Stackebrandtia nassauensis (strain DSM 44728 / CIP 108903 / NRRL B-16338 / NBRC 102104 / LLR-40K-21) TaxID=446470 RepID=D3Q1I6_STANL|nr:magnesium/cobalt transporter CorA [Stackebrandtia nassauensis]ADD39834.1 magnesium and cobalt transport protein CorA [Stackebrandtia nassauensis DSM 44728]